MEGEGGGCGSTSLDCVLPRLEEALPVPVAPGGASEGNAGCVLRERTEAVSALSPGRIFSSLGLFTFAIDDLGLSPPRGTEPGIFDLIELRSDRDDSFVSDFENDGYLSKPGPSSGVPDLFSPFEGWFPIFDMSLVADQALNPALFLLLRAIWRR